MNFAGDIEYTTKVRLRADDISDILHEGIEGGISNWAVLDDITTDYEETAATMQDASKSDVATEDNYDAEWFLYMDKWFDAIDSDMLILFVLFNEIICEK